MRDVDERRPVEPISAQQASRLFEPLIGQPSIAVAVSGGSDSMACLRLVHRWVAEAPDRPALTCLTVDHRLRRQSTSEAEQVADWCGQIGVACQILTWQGPQPKTNIQQAARRARYDLMTSWCRANQTSTLIVAHHIEDQAETLLMRLARGSAVGGLGGMATSSKWQGVTVFRPLLGVARAQLAATLSGFGQGWTPDPSNTDPAFERVRVRAALPGLADIGLTPSGLARSARRARRAAKALDEIAETILAQATAGEQTSLGHATFLAAPEEIQMRLLAALIARAGGDTLTHGRQLERAVATMQKPGFAAFTLGGCRIGNKKAAIAVTREAARKTL